MISLVLVCTSGALMTAFVPVPGPVQAGGRAEAMTIPAVEAAVTSSS